MAPKNQSSSSLKNPDLYEELRDDGASKSKAARISNAAARDGKKTVGKRGGSSPAYDDWTVADLRKRAKEIGLSGYSNQKKSELIDSLRNS